MNWKKINGEIINKETVKIETESGHIINFEPKINIFIDLDREEDGQPFFFVEFPFEYIKTESGKKSISKKKIEKMLNRRILDEYWSSVEKQGY